MAKMANGGIMGRVGGLTDGMLGCWILDDRWRDDGTLGGGMVNGG